MAASRVRPGGGDAVASTEGTDPMTDATNQADATKRPSRAGDDLDDRVEQAIGEAKAAADRAAQEADSTLDAMKSAASDAADRGAAAIADTASQARAVTEDARYCVSIDEGIHDGWRIIH